MRRLSFMLALALAACPDDCVDDPGGSLPGPPVTDVIMVPGDAQYDQALGGRTVAWRALLQHDNGMITEPPVGSMQWSADCNTNGITNCNVTTFGSGDFGWITIPTTAPPVVNITARHMSGASAAAQLTRINVVPTGSDGVKSPTLTLAELPRIVVAGGTATGVCALPSVVTAFVSMGSFVNLTGQDPATCPSFASTFGSRVAGFYPGPRAWSGGATPDVVNAAPDTPPHALNIRVVLGLTGPGCDDSGFFQTCYTVDELNDFAQNLIMTQVAYANLLFEKNRAGIVINSPAFHRRQMPGLLNCASAPVPDPGPADDAWTPQDGEMMVYVAWRLTDLARGLTCHQTGTASVVTDPPPADAPYKVILIGYADALLASTLAHEIGHAMGLRWPVHVEDNDVTGFGTHNLMATTSDLAHDRFHLTVGQIHRMVADEASWLNASGIRSAGSATAKCQCGNQTPKSCPELGLEIPRLVTTPTYGANACPSRP